MRYLVVVALLAIGCGSIDASPPECSPGVSCSSCPDVDDPHFSGVECASATASGAAAMMCGIVDPAQAGVHFVKQNVGCFAFLADRMTPVQCVAACP